jgi:TolB-like protein
MSRFLKFVIEQALAGDAERLKEYVIGIEVFDRDASYDPRVDAIVRVEAARLRAKLAEYYAGEGRSDAVVLTLPKGGYAPAIKLAERPTGDANGNGTAAPSALGSFHAAAAPVAVAAGASRRSRPWLFVGALAGVAALAVAAWATWTAPDARARVAVLPFAPYPDAADPAVDAVALRITQGVTAELMRDGRFEVVASSAASAAAATATRPRDVAATLDADVLVEARLTLAGDRVSVEARASSSAREEKLWVAGFAGSAADSDPLEREIAAAIAAALGAPRVAAN